MFNNVVVFKNYKLHHISTMQTKFILCCHMLHHQQSGYSPTHLNGLRCLLELSQAIKVSITEAYGSSTSAQDSCPCQSYSGITPRDLQCSSHNVTTTTVICCRNERPFYFWISVFSFCFIITVLFKILEKTIFFKKGCPLVVNVVIEFTAGFYEQYL